MPQILLAATSISDNGAGSAIDIGPTHELFVMLDASAVPTGGAPTLDVYLQSSPDGGTTWKDCAHTQFTTSALKRFIPISGYVTGGTSIVAASDAALAGETVVQGPFGDKLRVKYVFAAGGSSGSYTLAAHAVTKG